MISYLINYQYRKQKSLIEGNNINPSQITEVVPSISYVRNLTDYKLLLH